MPRSSVIPTVSFLRETRNEVVFYLQGWGQLSTPNFSTLVLRPLTTNGMLVHFFTAFNHPTAGGGSDTRLNWAVGDIGPAGGPGGLSYAIDAAGTPLFSASGTSPVVSLLPASSGDVATIQVGYSTTSKVLPHVHFDPPLWVPLQWSFILESFAGNMGINCDVVGSLLF